MYSVLTPTCCLSLLDPVPSYLDQVAMFGLDIKPTLFYLRERGWDLISFASSHSFSVAMCLKILSWLLFLGCFTLFFCYCFDILHAFLLLMCTEASQNKNDSFIHLFIPLFQTFGSRPQVCLFFHCFPLIPQVNTGLTFCSQHMLFSCCTWSFQPSMLSALRLRDVFHCLSESHINTISAAVVTGGREAAHTANNYIFSLCLLSSPHKSYSSSCQILSHLTGGCADAGPGYPTLTVLFWKVQRWHGFYFNTSSYWPVFPPLSVLLSC